MVICYLLFVDRNKINQRNLEAFSIASLSPTPKGREIASLRFAKFLLLLF
jgi:hypothetical protein